MKVVDIADEIYQALAEPSDISLVSVVYWLRSNIGALNNYINQDFYVDDSTLEINRVDDSDASLIIEMAPIEAAILKKMYSVYYYNKQVLSTLGAASTDAVIELESDGSRITKINKNEQSKTYAQLKKQEYDELLYLLNSYKLAKAMPNQVAGNDTIEGAYSPVYRNNRFPRIQST